MFGNNFDLSFSNLFLQDHVESRLSKNIIKQARLQVRYFYQPDVEKEESVF